MKRLVSSLLVLFLGLTLAISLLLTDAPGVIAGEQAHTIDAQNGTGVVGAQCTTLFGLGNPFPNPAGVGSIVSTDIDLIVRDGNGQLHSATIRTKRYNAIGQYLGQYTTVAPSGLSVPVVLWFVPLQQSSGVYFLQTRAESNICGNSPWRTTRLTVVN